MVNKKYYKGSHGNSQCATVEVLFEMVFSMVVCAEELQEGHLEEEFSATSRSHTKSGKCKCSQHWTRRTATQEI
jgi:hypothetical protein